MKFQKFEDILAWEKAQDMTVLLYKSINPIKDYGFKDQIRRASISISNNIAEGFDRCSNREFIRFLYYSLGSCSEVKSMLYLGLRLNYINEQEFQFFKSTSIEISKMITGLIKYLKLNADGK